MEYIRRLNTEDIQLYREIRLELLKEEPSKFGSSFDEESMFEEKMWFNRLAKNNVYNLAYFIDDEIAGIVVCVLNVREKMKHGAMLNSMFVRSKYRNKGIGRKLIEEAINILEENNIKIINLSVAVHNINAISLYESLGFKIVGKEEMAINYDNQYIDLYLMNKKL